MLLLLLLCYKPRPVGPYGPEGSRTTAQVCAVAPQDSEGDEGGGGVTERPLDLEGKVGLGGPWPGAAQPPPDQLPINRRPDQPPSQPPPQVRSRVAQPAVVHFLTQLLASYRQLPPAVPRAVASLLHRVADPSQGVGLRGMLYQARRAAGGDRRGCPAGSSP